MALQNKPNVNRVWAEDGAIVQPSESKIDTGWVVERPPYQIQNYLQNRSDAFLKHINQAGIPVWDALTVYTANRSYVQGNDGIIYRSLKSGSGNDPTNDINGSWEVAFSTSPGGDISVLTSYNSLENFPDYNDVYINTAGYAGFFKYNSNLTNTSNGGTQFSHSSGIGAWQRIFDGPVDIRWFGANSSSDVTSSLNQALTVSDFIVVRNGEFSTTGVSLSSNATVLFENGLLKSSNNSSRIFSIQNGSTLKLINPQLRGYRLTDDSSKTNHGIVVDNGVLIAEGVGEISYFAGWGILFITGGAASSISQIGAGITVKENGGGINTNDYEYFSIDGTKIIKNGLNVAKTDWSEIEGPKTGWGIKGRYANGSILNCTIQENAIGSHLNSQDGANPDHGTFANNSVNHNYAAGAIFENLHSYETVIGNRFLSNVTQSSAPNVTFSSTGTSYDFIVVNCVAMQVAFNDIGTGSGGIIPIYGHACCRYAFNNLVYGAFTELSHPQPEAMINQLYGYTKNSDNEFFGNRIRNDSVAGITQSILPDSLRTVVDLDIESAGVSGPGTGGGKLIDGVPYQIQLEPNWGDVSGAQTSWVSRRCSKYVDIYIYVLPSSVDGSPITILPVEYRPKTGAVQLTAAVGNNLSHSYGTIYNDGTVTISGAIAGQPVLIHGTYMIK